MYDVIIVGGGVAGCYLASKIDPRRKVLLVERNESIIPKDSGIVSSKFLGVFGGKSRKLVKSDITRMDCISPNGSTFSLCSDKPYAHILHRDKFSRALRKAGSKNAEFVIGNASDVEIHRDRVSVKTTGDTYEGKIIVGCDGANSVVRKSMGIESPRLALGIMVKTRQRIEGDITVHFNKYFSPDFFSWIIPQNNEYGMMTAVRPRDYFNYFVKSMYLPGGKMYAYMIPFTYTKSFTDRALLVGDSCGQNKPLTGGGIMFSLLGATHAAGMINDALDQKRFDQEFLRYYEKYWRRELAWEIEKQFLARMIYRNLTNNEIDDVFAEFGPFFTTLTSFDYDKLGNSWGHFPKLKFAKFILKNIPRMLR